jgi:hypothetical protein
MEDVKKGEAVIFIEDYNLFDTDCNGLEGMFYRESIGGKCLVYVPVADEWAEPLFTALKRKKAGHVPRKYAKLCKRISELRTTLETG